MLTNDEWRQIASELANRMEKALIAIRCEKPNVGECEHHLANGLLLFLLLKEKVERKNAA